VGPGVGWVVPLREAAECEERSIGGKAAKLAQLAQTGFRVPGGFSITTNAYQYFVEKQDLARLIRIELGRKPFASMRWEEIWDVALRIRSAFLASPIPHALSQAIAAAVEELGVSKPQRYGMRWFCRASTVLITPASPAAASAWPTLFLTEPILNGLSVGRWQLLIDHYPLTICTCPTRNFCARCKPSKGNARHDYRGSDGPEGARHRRIVRYRACDGGTLRAFAQIRL